MQIDPARVLGLVTHSVRNFEKDGKPASAVTLTRLGFAGVVLASQGTAEQVGTQIQSLREALEQVPTPKGEKGDVRLGGFAAGGASLREAREE